MRVAAWALFAAVQLVSLVFVVLGWLVLPCFCIAEAWEPCASRFDPKRTIDRWRFGPLNWIWGNDEDGVSGACAKIWGSGAAAGTLVAYMPLADPIWRACCWSIGRNPADNLKYVFRWRGKSAPPFKLITFTVLGRTFSGRVGWQVETGILVPVFSL